MVEADLMVCVWMTPEPSLRHAQKLRYSKVKSSLLEVILGLLQSIQPFRDCQVDSPYKKKHRVWNQNQVSCSEDDLLPGVISYAQEHYFTNAVRTSSYDNIFFLL